MAQPEHARHSISVAREVPGRPETVWQAVASGPGISSWFVDTDLEPRPGPGSELSFDFGPEQVDRAVLTAWDPPRSFEAESRSLGPEAPAVRTRWTVEARGPERCLVRVEQSLEDPGGDFAAALEAWEEGWPSFLHLLELSLGHLRGRPASTVQQSVPSSLEGPLERLLRALGIESPRPGAPFRSTTSPLLLAGRVHPGGAPGECLLRVDEPSPGLAHAFELPVEEASGRRGTHLWLRLVLTAAGPGDPPRLEPSAWLSWLRSTLAGP